MILCISQVDVDELEVMLKRRLYVSSLEQERDVLKERFGGDFLELMSRTGTQMQRSLCYGSEGGDDRCTRFDLWGRAAPGKSS